MAGLCEGGNEPCGFFKSHLTFVVDQLLPGSVFQQHGAPPHYYGEVWGFLNANFPNRLIGGEPLLGHLGHPS
ncbi:hypothetical protein ANN_06345 [Periplaneta americana]|uniref:Uncharacterized protein n=1 Tax=Periplaneta americana TaxID=6978 RepID=A0ABQ8TDG9_PERAM|nr:hypothetical protein ANN_06345 [Periplaneta americana]